MTIWAIADLHLSFGVANKKMDIFGSQWINHAEKIEQAWRESVKPDDLVLIAGDISWALHLEEVVPDLAWIDSLPGTKALLKGNHDYWWNSLNKVKQILPPSCNLIQNNSYNWNGVTIGGTRLWDTPEFNFNEIIEMHENPNAKKLTQSDLTEEKDKIFRRELARLEVSLRSMNPKAKLRIAMIHYPPIGLKLQDSEVSRILEKYHVDICVFGHLHNIKPDLKLFGVHNGIDYHLVACDYLQFKPLKIAD
jgi:predicted phosphohydrolase